MWDEVVRRSDGYLQQPLPNELDLVVGTLVERFIDGDEEARKAVLETLTIEAARALSVYGERMASQAVHDDSTATLLRGLVAVGMAATREYEKDLVRLLPLFDHSARTLTVDPDALFGHAAEVLGDVAPAWLCDFPERNESERSLQTMGYEEHPTEDGLLYTRHPSMSREEVEELEKKLGGKG